MEGSPKLLLYLWGVMLWAVACIDPAWAEKPVPWQMDFQPPATPVMERIVALHDFILVIQFLICALVGALILYIILRFRVSKNPKPSKTTHNSTLEVIWTLIPVVILLFIVCPSLRLLYYMDVAPKADMTIKAIGNQWYWTYEYPDEDITFDSMLVEDEDLKPGQMRLFEVDNRVVVPVNTTVSLITTSNDVLHSWAVPAFGVKKDSIPGRLNETWFKATKEGIYYGQCSELCGAKHGFMPIVVEVVSLARYKHWLAQQKPAPAPEPNPEPSPSDEGETTEETTTSEDEKGPSEEKTTSVAPKEDTTSKSEG